MAIVQINAWLIFIGQVNVRFMAVVQVNAWFIFIVQVNVWFMAIDQLIVYTSSGK